MGRTKLHSHVDILRGSGSCIENTDRLVDHRDQNSVYHEARSFLYLYRGLADLSCNGCDLVHHLLRGVLASDYLNQLHSVSRVEEMHTDHRSVKALADLCDGKGRGIGCKHAVLLHDALQLFENRLLDLHLLKRNLND